MPRGLRTACLGAACGFCLQHLLHLSVFCESLLLSARYLPVLPSGRIMAGLAFMTVSILLCTALALVRPRPQKRLWTAGFLFACIAILTSVDIIGGQNPVWHKDVALSPYCVSRSPVFTLAVREAADSP